MRTGPLPLLALLLGCAPDRPAEAPVPAYRAELVATIGSDSGPASFTSVRSVLFSYRRDELYVVDDREAEVRVFDTTGQFRRTIGRKGSGPGEYADPYSIALLHDTLALLDPGNARIGLFDQRGNWLGSLPVQSISGGFDVRLYRTPMPEFWAYGYRAVDGKAQSLFIRYTGAGPQDTLPLIRRESGRTTVITCEYPDRSLRFFEAPFAPSLIQIPTAEGWLAIASTDRYRIEVLRTPTDTFGILSRPEEGAPIGDGEWERGLATWTKARQEHPAAKCDADGFDRPERKPILGTMFVDHHGAIWVEVKTPAGSRYDRYDPGGTLLATVTGLPGAGEVDPDYRMGLLAIPLPTDDGFPRIGIYRFVPETN